MLDSIKQTKKDLNICQEKTHSTCKDKKKQKDKKTHHANTKKKRIGIAVLRQSTFQRKEYFIIIIHQEAIITLNVYASSNKASK